MKNNFTIPDEILEINFVFYNILKKLISEKISDKLLVDSISENIKNPRTDFVALRTQIDKKINENDTDIFAAFGAREDFGILLEFSMEILLIKPILLAQAKGIVQNKQILLGSRINKLSLTYDTLTLGAPYYLRVGGALLSLLLFEKMNDEKNLASIIDNLEIAARMRDNFAKLQKSGLEANQIFMIIFNESINQSIKSTAGGSFEERAIGVLVGDGIPRNKITKGHDSHFTDLEYDHIFTLNNKKIGISSKRTLRERYKQFLHHLYEIDVDVMINLTLGVDLNAQKLQNISEYKIWTIVADEVYVQNSYMQSDKLCIPSSEFTREWLEEITKEKK